MARAVTFLKGAQQPDGAFGPSEEPATATAEVLSTFAALRLSDPGMEPAQLFLADLPPAADSEIELRRRLALRGSPFSSSMPLLLAAGPGFEAPDALHLAWALRWALQSGAAPAEGLEVARDLVGQAGLDGCYAFADNLESVELTSTALVALAPLTFYPDVRDTESRGAACLLSKQSADGSFGSALATGEAILALSAHPDAGPSLTLARQWLVAMQLPDGSWDESVRTTAVAARALGAMGPDWRVTTDERGTPVIIIADPEPLQGAPVSVGLDVQNASAAAAPPTTVRFVAQALSDGAERSLGTTSVGPLGAGAVAHVSLQLPSDALAGRYVLRALVDPDDDVPELSETNNEGDAPLNVRQENDLAVSGQGIHFADAGNGQIQIQVAVQNLGAPLGQSVQVDVYKGTPTSGVKLGSGTVPAGLAVNASTTLSVAWDATSANGPTPITVIVDPQDQLPEANENNNQAFRYYYPGSGKPVDLAVTSSEIQFPAAPIANQPFTVSIPVHNLSGNDATDVLVQVREAWTGPLRGSITLPMVPAHGTSIAQVPVILFGSTWMRIEVDPSHQLQDTNIYNNSANTNGVQVRTSPDYDFNLSSFGSNGIPAVGSPVVLTAAVANVGAKSAQPLVVVRDERTGAVVNRVAVPLAPGETKTVSLATFSMPSTPPMYQACVDPDDLFPEPNENDNCAEWVGTSGWSDLSLHARDISVSPAGADVGETVHVKAVVRNQQPTAAHGVLEWWQGRPTAAEGIYLGKTPVSVPASGTAVAEFDFVRRPGPVEVYGRIAEVEPRDAAPTNNIGGHHLFLQAIVDVGTESYEDSSSPEIRFARLTHHDAPELIVGYRFSSYVAGSRAGVAVLQPQADGSYVKLWSAQRLPYLQDVQVGDLDGDGQAEVILESQAYNTGTYQNYPVGTVEISVFEPDGTLKWEKSFLSYDGDCASNAYSDNNFTIADVNDDGISDVVLHDQNIQAFSGQDGHTLWSTPIATRPDCEYGTIDVLDAYGDGKREVLFSNESTFYLVKGESGEIIWQHAPTGSSYQAGWGTALADLDSDGAPDLVIPLYRGGVFGGVGVEAVDIASGQVKQQGAFQFPTWPLSVAIGDVRQNGLADVLLANDDYTASTAAVGPDLEYLWVHSFANGEGSDALGVQAVDVFDGALADLFGRGRPQYVLNGMDSSLVIQDGRTGEVLLPPTPNPPGGQYAEMTPAVVDAYGNGHGAVAVGFRMLSTGPVWNNNSAPSYGPGEVLIFTSPHWKDMPTTWTSRQSRHGRVDEDLKVSEDYRWWTHDNTWNDQYIDTPSKLLADLAVLPSDLSASPALGVAGDPTTVDAIIRNRGGLAASNVKVSLYDGDPQQGGKWLADTVVPGPLAARTGTATARFVWTAYPEGAHTLYVVANSDSAIEESGREDNTASLKLFVQPGSQLCDLAMVDGSLGAAPADVVAGASLQLTAQVTNLGPVPCDAAQLAVEDGPESNAQPFGSAPIPALAPGASASLTVSGTAVPGSHLFRFVADASAATQDGDRSNNQAVLEFYVAPSAKPDLLWTAASISPASAYPGEPVVLTATVRNEGAASPASSFSIMLGGTTVAQGALPPLLSGAQATVTASLVAPGATSDLLLLADPANTVDEFDESNNGRAATLEVAAPTLSLAGSVTPAELGGAENAAVSVSVTSRSAVGQEVSVTLEVVDPAGKLLATLVDQERMVLAGGAVQTLDAAWNSGSEPVGGYHVHVIAESGGRQVATAVLPFSITGASSARSTLTTDRKDYAPGEQVLLTQRLTNTSVNAPLQSATLVIAVADGAGRALYQSSRPVPSLPLGGFFDSTDLFEISPNLVPGGYVATARVTDAAGTLIAQATADFSIQYPAAASVTATVSVESPFGLGPPLPISVALANGGSADLTEGRLTAILLDTATRALEGQAAQTVSVPAHSGAQATLTLQTGAVTPGQKLLVIALDGRVVDRALVEATLYVDRTPPTVLITGVADLELTKDEVIPSITVQDESPHTATITLDGEAFESGTPVTSEGDHVLAVVAQDAYGNRTEVAVRFTIDRTAPVLTLSGVTDGALLNTPVTLSYSATDAHPGTTTGVVDEASIAPGTELAVEGDHVWVVTSTDAAGNVATESRSFTLDFTPPRIAISGVQDGQLSNQPLSPVIAVEDAHPGLPTILLDHQPFSSGTAVTTEGPHTLQVSATDGAGNTSQASVGFELDFTKPQIQFGGVSNGALVNHLVTPTVTVTDRNLDTFSATLDGQPFESGAPVSTEGVHVLTVHATDKAGNASDAALTFTIDLTPPAIQVVGVTDGAFYNHPVTPTFAEVDEHAGAISALLDGQPFAAGDSVSAEGPHTLSLHAVDLAGNTADKLVSFEIDVTAPVITLSGVSDGAFYNHPVTPTFNATDRNLASVDASLDGGSFHLGDVVSAEGPHTLVVVARDRAGNERRVEVGFELDFTLPAISITGVEDGAYYAHPPIPTCSASDRNLMSTTAELDGAPFVSGTAVQPEGPHTLLVKAVDKAGNVATATVTFINDFTAPVISIAGVSEGARAESFTPTFGATDANLASVNGTLNGAPFVSGTTVLSLGPNTLVVTALDKAGNQARATVHFIVMPQRPPFHHAVCALGALSLSNSAQVGGPQGAPGSAGADGELIMEGSATIWGDAVAGGNLSLRNAATLSGTAFHGGTFETANGSSAGNAVQVSPAPAPCACGYDLAAQMADAKRYNDDGLLTAAPDFRARLQNGALVVSKDALVLPSGTFYLTGLSLSNGARLTVVAGGHAELFVDGDVTVVNHSILGDDAQDASRLLVVTSADSATGGSVVLRNNSSAALWLYAPRANLTLGNHDQLHGAIVGRDVALENNQTLLPSPSPQPSPPPFTCH